MGDVEVEGSLDFSDYEKVGFRILKGGSRAKSKMDFRRADFDLFRDLLGRVAWHEVLKGREAQKS